MNWQTFHLSDESDGRPIERLSFDILRVLVANRQATSPTVRALAEQQGEAVGERTDPAVARVRMLAGHATAANTSEAAGTFFSSRASDQSVGGQGERHA